MKFFILIIATYTFLTVTVDKHVNSQNKTHGEVLYISVNGLVCDFCARSIEKLFIKKESVDHINVNLEKMLITINLKKGKNLDNESIKQVIKDSGYDIKEIYRDKY